jgi:predicted anti-sigma-YlaC factor YlaD
MSASNTQPLNCARVRVLIETYIDGDLGGTDPTLAAAVRDHLAGCDDCRRQHHQAISLPFRLKALSSPQPRMSLVSDVMREVSTTRLNDKRAWTLLAPEAALAAFILWYLSGVQGLATIASGIFTDLQTLTNWGAGAGSLPSIPAVDLVFLIALIVLTALAGYHISVLARLDATPPQGPRGMSGRIAGE